MTSMSNGSLISFPIIAPAVRVEQPLGTFYAVSLPAAALLEICFTERLTARPGGDGLVYSLEGVQRERQEKRLRDIAAYIDREDSAFPNSIILGANYTQSGHLFGESEDDHLATAEYSKRWSILEDNSGRPSLTIPSSERLAAVIDGQHRLFAFALARSDRRSTQLLCSVYMDLPKPYQAQLFATINSTQKPVDRSLTYELFGYNVDDEAERFWSPDKLAVFLARRLAVEQDSPLRGRITLSPANELQSRPYDKDRDLRVSMAVVVQGIVRLISSDPKRDANFLHTIEGAVRFVRRPRSDLEKRYADRSPMRAMYINGNDALIYAAVKNFLTAVDQLFWSVADAGSFIRKTVGVQALFDVLRLELPKMISRRDLSVRAFLHLLDQAAEIDFREERFRSPSGSGRTLIRKALLEAI